MTLMGSVTQLQQLQSLPDILTKHTGQQQPQQADGEADEQQQAVVLAKQSHESAVPDLQQSADVAVLQQTPDCDVKQQHHQGASGKEQQAETAADDQQRQASTASDHVEQRNARSQQQPAVDAPLQQQHRSDRRQQHSKGSALLELVSTNAQLQQHVAEPRQQKSPASAEEDATTQQQLMHKKQQKQQRTEAVQTQEPVQRRRRVTRASVSDHTAGTATQSAEVGPIDLAWLPDLLQQQKLYTYCPECLPGWQEQQQQQQPEQQEQEQQQHNTTSRRLKVYQLRWFDLSAGHSIYCNRCKPADALTVGQKAGSDGQLIQQVLMATDDVSKQSVLLAIPNTGMKSKTAMKLEDAQLLGLNTADIRCWKQKEGARSLLLLQPRFCWGPVGSGQAMLAAAAYDKADWQCEDCSQASNSSALYCSIRCKFQATGLQGFLQQQQQQQQCQSPVSLSQQAGQQDRQMAPQRRNTQPQQTQQPQQQRKKRKHVETVDPLCQEAAAQAGEETSAEAVPVSKKRKLTFRSDAASDKQSPQTNSSKSDHVVQQRPPSKPTSAGCSRQARQQQQPDNWECPAFAATALTTSNDTILGPRPGNKVSKEPWDVDLIGVKLGCGKCRYATHGCYKCRNKARVRLAQEGVQVKQQESQQQQQQLLGGSVAAAAVDRAAAADKAARAPAGAQQRQRPQSAAAAAAPSGQQQQQKRCKAAASGSAPSTAAPASAGRQHLQPKRPRSAGSGPSATAAEAGAVAAAAIKQQEASQSAWVSVLLQQQGFYQQCPRCDKEKRPVRWFDIHAPHGTYCISCRPDNAIKVRSRQHEATLSVDGPLLLPLITSSYFSRLWGKERVVIPSASPHDLAAVNVDVSNVKVIIRNQGYDLKKEVVLLHPRSAADINQGQQCRHCAELQQSEESARYCSVACKVRQAGLQALQGTPQQGQQRFRQPPQQLHQRITQQQRVRQQQPAKSPAVQFQNKYKFPALRLSGPQPNWSAEAWQQHKRTGLEKLAQLQTAVGNNSGNDHQHTPAAAVHTEQQQELLAAEEQPTAAVVPTNPAASSSSSWPSTAVLLLLHGTGCPNAAIWQSWCDSHAVATGGASGRVSLFCHVKEGVDVSSDSSCVGRELIQQHMLDTRVDAKWGDTSLVKAFLDSLSEVLVKCGVLNSHQTWAIGGAGAALTLAAQQAAGGEAAAAVGNLLVAPEQADPTAAAGEQQEAQHVDTPAVASEGAADDQQQQVTAAVEATAATGQKQTAAVAASDDQLKDQHQQNQQQPVPAPSSSVQPAVPAATISSEAEDPATCLASTQQPTTTAAAAAAPSSSSSKQQHHQGLRHVLLASGTDIPLKLLPAGALPAGVTLYGSYDYSREDVADLQEVMYDGMIEAGFSAADARQWTSCLAPHHQWMCVSVEHALVLVAMRDQILRVADAVHAAWHEAKCGIAADEYVLITALRVAGCVQALKPCRTPRQLAACEPGAAANCHPTQVMYPIPHEWTQQLQQQGHIDASGPVSADNGTVKMSSTSGRSECGTESNGNGCRGALAAAPARSCADLFKASFVADKHPVTWRGVSDVVWCEEEENNIVYAAKISMRNLLAIAAERGCLTMRKVDCGGDKQAQAELLKLLQRTWAHDAPKVRFAKRVAMIDKQKL